MIHGPGPGSTAGMVNLAVFERMPWPGVASSRWGYLANAYVAPEFRNAGVGKLLVDALMAYARAEGLVRVVLSPSERSVRFYERAGFAPGRHAHGPAAPTTAAGGLSRGLK